MQIYLVKKLIMANFASNLHFYSHNIDNQANYER